jgi:hypothetical protein
MTRAFALNRARETILKALVEIDGGGCTFATFLDLADFADKRTDEGTSVLRIVDQALKRLKVEGRIEYRRTTACWHLKYVRGSDES